ncbi:MAG: ribonuclease P protein component, partial [Proteobacteria bacterium]|nr:ribonuclease P protein component [Pseudomonadota bacterium]
DQRMHLPAGTYVAVAKPAAAQADNPALRAALLELLARAARLPVQPAIGTMPRDASSTSSSPDAGTAASHSD